MRSCFGTQFKLTRELTVVESDIHFGIPYNVHNKLHYKIAINNLWNTIYMYEL